MTARQVLNAKAGQKVGLGNGLRLVCDKRNDGRYFELRKRVRGKDYSWGVGNVETLTIAGCNKALSSARKQADKILPRNGFREDLLARVLLCLRSLPTEVETRDVARLLLDNIVETSNVRNLNTNSIPR